MVQVTHCEPEFCQVQSKSAIRLLGERAFIHQAIELNRHALAMRLVQSKAKAAKHGSHVSGIELSLRRFIRRQHLGQFHLRCVVHHVLEREQAGNIGLGFFECAVDLFQFIPHGRIPAVRFDLMRAQPVH